jgi:hypothetical protein
MDWLVATTIVDLVARVLDGQLLVGQLLTWWVRHVLSGQDDGQHSWWSTTYLMNPSCAEWPEWWPGFLMVNYLPDESTMCWVARMVARVPDGQLLTLWVHHVLSSQDGGQSPWWSTKYLMSPSCAEWPEWWPGFLMINHIKWLLDAFDYWTIILAFNLHLIGNLFHLPPPPPTTTTQKVKNTE